MKVRYICDSCRSLIAEFGEADLPANRPSRLLANGEEPPEFDPANADALVLYSLCDECAAVLEMAPPPLPYLQLPLA